MTMPTKEGDRRQAPNDRRAHARADYRQTIWFKPKKRSNCDGVVADVSESGLLLVSKYKLSVGTEILFYMPFVENEKPVTSMVSGRIVRSDDRSSERTFGYGVKLDRDLPRSSKRIIQKYVQDVTGVAPAPEPDLHYIEPEKEISRENTFVKRVDASRAKRQTRKEDRKKRSKKLTRFQKLCAASIGALVLLTAVSGYSSFKRSMWESELSMTVPIRNADVEDQNLFAQTDEAWIREVSKSQKKAQLKMLAARLYEEKIYSAILTDSQGIRVAVIMKNRTKLSRPMIRIIQ